MGRVEGTTAMNERQERSSVSRRAALFAGIAAFVAACGMVAQDVAEAKKRGKRGNSKVNNKNHSSANSTGVGGPGGSGGAGGDVVVGCPPVCIP